MIVNAGNLCIKIAIYGYVFVFYFLCTCLGVVAVAFSSLRFMQVLLMSEVSHGDCWWMIDLHFINIVRSGDVRRHDIDSLDHDK